MNNALIIAKNQIEMEDAASELVALVKANPIKRNASGRLNVPAMAKIANAYAARFEGNAQNISGYNFACNLIRTA